MWRNLLNRTIVWNNKSTSYKWLSILKANLIWTPKVNSVWTLIENLKISEPLNNLSLNSNRVDLKFSLLRILWKIVIELLRIDKGQDRQEISLRKLLLLHKLKSLLLVLDKGYLILMILVCIRLQLSKEEVERNKNKKYWTNYRSFREFKSSMSRS